MEMVSISVLISEFDMKRDFAQPADVRYLVNRNIWLEKDPIVPGREHSSAPDLEIDGWHQVPANMRQGIERQPGAKLILRVRYAPPVRDASASVHPQTK